MIAQIIDVFAFWDVLPDQTIGIFVEAPLPGVIRVSEEPFGVQVVGDLFMVSEFSSIVVIPNGANADSGWGFPKPGKCDSMAAYLGGRSDGCSNRITVGF